MTDTGCAFIPNWKREKQHIVQKATPPLSRASDGACWADVISRRFVSAPTSSGRVRSEVPSPSAPEDGDDMEQISVMSYNILSCCGAQKQWYPRTPERALAWSHRKPLLMKEILAYDADVVCLQEVDQFAEIERWLRAGGKYVGVYKKRAGDRRTDGSAIFVRAERFELERAAGVNLNDLSKLPDAGCAILCKDNDALLAIIRSRSSGRRILVASAHLYWDPASEHVRLQQARGVLEAAARFGASSEGGTGSAVPLISIADPGARPPAPPDGLPILICGDFNAEPGSLTYKYLRRGHVRFRRRPAPACDKGAEEAGECDGAVEEPSPPPPGAGEEEAEQEEEQGTPSPAKAAVVAAAVAARKKAPRCSCDSSEGLGVRELSHGFDLESAYERYVRPGAGPGAPERVGEPAFTHWTEPDRKFTCDYVFFSARHFRVASLLQLPEEGEVGRGLPNMAFPSDHLSIAARLLLPGGRPATKL